MKKENYKNRAVEVSDRGKIRAGQQKPQDYFFPDYQITVQAASMKEAEEKVKKILEKRKSAAK